MSDEYAEPTSETPEEGAYYLQVNLGLMLRRRDRMLAHLSGQLHEMQIANEILTRELAQARVTIAQFEPDDDDEPETGDAARVVPIGITPDEAGAVFDQVLTSAGGIDSADIESLRVKSPMEWPASVDDAT